MNFLKSSPETDAAIVVEGAFKAPIERVWRAWTQPEELARWFGGEAGEFLAMATDVRVGGAWRFDIAGDPPSRLQGEYLVVEPHARLVFTWSHVQPKPGGGETATPESEVSVAFGATEGGCVVRLRHEGIQSLSGLRGVSSGWDGSFKRLAAAL